MRYFLPLPLRVCACTAARCCAVVVAAAARNDDNNLHTKSHCAQNYYLISNQSNILSFFITCEL